MFKFAGLLGLLGCVSCSPLWPKIQFHDQDGAGSYRYAYQGPHHAKMETRSNGITQGGYSYVDANGILQTVAYTADAEKGFRVRASNLPQAAAVQQPATIYQRTDNSLDDGTNVNQQSTPPKNPFLLSNAEAARIGVPRPSYSNLPTVQAASELQYHAPAVLLPATRPLLLPVSYRMAHSSLRHTQDSLGQYDYSYAGDTSAKTESRSLDGTTRGAYSYIDANGLLQHVQYIADHNGFRVLATNLPQA